MKLNIFLAYFQILGPLGCQGRVVIPQNVKKSQNHYTLLYSLHSSLVERQLPIRGARAQAQANPLYLNLDSLFHEMKMRAV